VSSSPDSLAKDVVSDRVVAMLTVNNFPLEKARALRPLSKGAIWLTWNSWRS